MSRRRKIPIALLAVLLLAWGAVTLWVLVRDRQEIGGLVGPAALEEQVEISARLIREPGELAGEEVHVPSHTQTLERLVELEDRISGDIHIVELGGDVSHEELIQEVAAGGVALTAAPETIARLNQAYFTNIAVRPSWSATTTTCASSRTAGPRPPPGSKPELDGPGVDRGCLGPYSPRSSLRRRRNTMTKINGFHVPAPGSRDGFAVVAVECVANDEEGLPGEA